MISSLTKNLAYVQLSIIELKKAVIASLPFEGATVSGGCFAVGLGLEASETGLGEFVRGHTFQCCQYLVADNYVIAREGELIKA